MSDKTGIEWTDATWNPTTGCDKVSPGCDNCYAMKLAPRLKAMGSPRYQHDGDPATSGPGFAYTEHPEALESPLRWQRGRRIFVNSMSDLFHSDATREFQAQVFAVMALTPRHTYQLLTKRPGVMRSVLSSPDFVDRVWWHAGQLATVRGRSGELGLRQGHDSSQIGTWPLPNVWVGTSVEDQKRADLRVPALLDTPAAVRFLSCEPLLGSVSLFANTTIDTGTLVDWVIVGGESGPGARPMHPEWARGLADECTRHGIAFHFKQWGEWTPAGFFAGDTSILDNRTHAFVSSAPAGYSHQVMRRVGKKAAGRVLDGRTWDEFPQAVTA